MAQETTPVFVKAIYPFKGANNDELNFKAGDVITITQKEVEGWCEGTLNGRTGWFPSNYVKEFKPELSTVGKTSNGTDSNLQSREYRNQVLKDMIESETSHVQELSFLFKTYLQPLKKANILNEQLYNQMVGNYEQVLTIQTQLLHKLEESLGFIGKDQRVGFMFMQIAPHFKKIHISYCSNHPKAAAILTENRDELAKFMQELGSQSATIMTLTTALSKPFRRLEKYQGLLQELERHTDEAHIDRGDCQRAVAVYRDISIECSERRRQKEMELEVMIPGRIKEWEGDDISTLGDIIQMSQVGIYLPETKDSSQRDKKDRYFVLFPETLLMLSVSHRLSSFIYEGKLPISGIDVKKLDTKEYKHAFEVGGGMIERIVASCSSKDERDSWVDLLKERINICQSTSTANTLSCNPKSPTGFRNTMQDQLLLQNSTVNNSFTTRNSLLNQVSNSKFNQTLSPDGGIIDKKLQTSNPSIPPHRSPTPPLAVNTPETSHSRSNISISLKSNVISNKKNGSLWTMSCLHPSPPLRPCISIGNSNESNKKNSSKKKVEERSYEDDMKILRVIEAYCTSAKTRNTINSVDIRQLREHCARQDEEVQNVSNQSDQLHSALTYSLSSHGGGWCSLLDCPQVLIAEEEKMIVEETKGNQIVIEEKSLVDTVYALKDEVKELYVQTGHLSCCLEEEKKARLRLESFLKKHISNGREDLCWDD
ncbi:Rho guanine nucleotide exchange factor 7 [Nymphon striatum]|nr:Rho guanine nucleotide exchange factor 7 [Nymphon striatum]